MLAIHYPYVPTLCHLASRMRSELFPSVRKLACIHGGVPVRRIRFLLLQCKGSVRVRQPVDGAQRSMMVRALGLKLKYSIFQTKALYRRISLHYTYTVAQTAQIRMAQYGE